MVTCSVSDLSVTSFIGFRSDINWLIRSLSESLCSLCILLFLVLLYFQHTNVSKGLFDATLVVINSHIGLGVSLGQGCPWVRGVLGGRG